MFERAAARGRRACAARRPREQPGRSHLAARLDAMRSEVAAGGRARLGRAGAGARSRSRGRRSGFAAVSGLATVAARVAAIVAARVAAAVAAATAAHAAPAMAKASMAIARAATVAAIAARTSAAAMAGLRHVAVGHQSDSHHGQEQNQSQQKRTIHHYTLSHRGAFARASLAAPRRQQGGRRRSAAFSCRTSLAATQRRFLEFGACAPPVRRDVGDNSCKARAGGGRPQPSTPNWQAPRAARPSRTQAPRQQRAPASGRCGPRAGRAFAKRQDRQVSAPAVRLLHARILAPARSRPRGPPTDADREFPLAATAARDAQSHADARIRSPAARPLSFARSDRK